MKVSLQQLLLTIFSICLVAACSSKSGENSQAKNEREALSADNNQESQTTEAEELPKAVKLMNASDCGVCHKTEDKLIGPSYKEIADKYEESPKVVDTLSNKIIKGGVGVWGEVAMTAHPTLSQEDAEVMVKYILSLKKYILSLK